MNCVKVQELLSAYHDGELLCEEQTSVAQHLDGCGHCAGALEDFQKLSVLSAQLPSPEPPARLWAELERELELATGTEQASWAYPRGRLLAKVATLAALVLIAGVTGLVGYRLAPESDLRGGTPSLLAVDLDRYLLEFQRNPAQAPRVFIARYEGQPAELREVAKRVHYRPVAADRLPEGFSLDSVYLLKMECCTGVETIYKRKGSDVLAILQHTTEQPVWFGDRPVVTAQVNGKPTKIVQVGGRLAASWQANGTYVSLVGAQDLAELMRLIAYLDRNTQEN